MKHSETIGQLADALAKCQQALTAVTPNKKNTHLSSKYADLASVMAALRGPLGDNGLAISQGIGSGTTGPIITTMLIHASGEWLSDTNEIPLGQGKGVSEAQRVGSAITYGRRYGALAIVGGTVSDDDDDGGNAGAKPTRQESQAKPISPAEQIMVDSFLDEIDTLLEKAEVQAWGKDKAGEIGKLGEAAQKSIRAEYMKKLQGAK